MQARKPWVATAVPGHEPGHGEPLPGPYYEGLNYGPCPWRDGEPITLRDAEKLTGVPRESLLKKSYQWRALVSPPPHSAESYCPPIKWFWHWHVVALPVDARFHVMEPDKWCPGDWDKRAEPHYEDCHYVNGEEITLEQAAKLRGWAVEQCERISERWCCAVAWHVEEAASMAAE